jgi:hypothetical protein
MALGKPELKELANGSAIKVQKNSKERETGQGVLHPEAKALAPDSVSVIGKVCPKTMAHFVFFFPLFFCFFGNKA